MKIAFFVGPSWVHEIAEGMRAAGVEVTCEGTERIYVEAPVPEDFDDAGLSVREHAAREAVVAKVKAHHGKTFGLHEIRLFS